MTFKIPYLFNFSRLEKFMTKYLLVILSYLAFPMFGAVTFAETPTLRISVLEFGTVNWEMRTIKSNKLDEKNGFTLDVKGVAGSSAAKIALQGGDTDIIVSDWLWVARQRAAGKDLVFIPYSKAVGGVMLPQNSEIKTLADLKGKKIGIAGGPLDKSWLIINAYTQQEYGLDLVQETEQVFASPPLIFKSALSGEIDGAINFWHFMAKMKAAGMSELISVSNAAKSLGLDPDLPLLGYVVDGTLARSKPKLIDNFANASRAAKNILNDNDSEWNHLRQYMNVNSNEQFEELKAGFRAGIPPEKPINQDSVQRMFQFLVNLTGEELVGSAKELPKGIFFNSES